MIDPEAPAPVIRVEELYRRFGPVAAVGGISFGVRPGEMFGMIGPDGAGKTTTLRMILGLLTPDQGRIEVCGLEPSRRRAELSRRVGYLSQRFSLYGDLSVDENIAFFAEVHGVRRWKPKRDELLEMLRLSPFRRRLADRLSGGMKQKLALACTLVHTPELLVLDEPTTGVDPVSRREFWKILARLQRERLTILLTTPYLDEAERCQRVALIDRGRLLYVDTPEAIKAGSVHPILEIIARPRRGALDWLRRQPEVADVEIFGERVHVTLSEGDGNRGEQRASLSAKDVDDLQARLADGLRKEGVEVDGMRRIPPSLEDTFIARIRAGVGDASTEVWA